MLRNKLTLLRKTSIQGKDKTYLYEYVCECGKTCLKRKKNVDKGTTASCGCYRRIDNLPDRTGISPPNALLDPTESSFNALYCQYKNAATKRNLVFQLTKEQFKILTKNNCHYCGKEPYRKRKQAMAREPYVFNGIDRKNNAVGYILENCVAACKDCNFLKNTINYDVFLKLLRTIVENTQEIKC